MTPSTTRELLRAVSRRNPERRSGLVTTMYGVVLIVAMVISIVLHGVTVTLRPSVQSAAMVIPGLAFTFVVLLAASAALGPFALAAPHARWLGNTPLPRWELLKHRALGNFALIATLGGLCGVIVGLLSAPGWQAPAACFIAGLSVGVVAYLLAAYAQQHRSDSAARAFVQCMLPVSMAGVALAAIRPVGLPTWTPLAIATFMTTTALCAGAVMGRKIPQWAQQTPLSSLRAAGDRTSAWLDAAVSLDTDGLVARQELHRARSRGSLRSVLPGSNQPYVDLIRRDLTGHIRQTKRIASRIAACACTFLVATLFGSTVAVVWLSVSLLALASTLSPRLRTWLESTSLWRSLPQHPRRVAWALSVPPLLTLLIVGGVSGAVSGLPTAGFSLALAALAPALRRHNRPTMQVGETLETPFGQVPLGIVMAVTYGFETVGSTLFTGLVSSWPIAVLVAASWLIRSLWTAWPVGSQPKNRR